MADAWDELNAGIEAIRNGLAMIVNAAGSLARGNMKDAQRIAELERALAPFADYVDWTSAAKMMPPDFVITKGSGMARRQLTAGDCYEALRVKNSIP